LVVIRDIIIVTAGGDAQMKIFIHR